MLRHHPQARFLQHFIHLSVQTNEFPSAWQGDKEQTGPDLRHKPPAQKQCCHSIHYCEYHYDSAAWFRTWCYTTRPVCLVKSSKLMQWHQLYLSQLWVTDILGLIVQRTNPTVTDVALMLSCASAVLMLCSGLGKDCVLGRNTCSPWLEMSRGLIKRTPAFEKLLQTFTTTHFGSQHQGRVINMYCESNMTHSVDMSEQSVAHDSYRCEPVCCFQKR